MKNKQIDNENIAADEHFVDIFKEFDLMRDNLSENTDTAFEILKLYDNALDQESVDVLRITCSNILDCEELAKSILEKYESVKKQVFAGKTDSQMQQQVLELLKEIKKLEKTSSKNFKQLLELSASIK